MDSELPINVADYARAARARLPNDVFDYYEGGALDEITLRENPAGWERLKLYYRVLAGVGPRDMSTTVLGRTRSRCRSWSRRRRFTGWLASREKSPRPARPKRPDTLFILSSLSNTAMEAVFAEAGSPRWFQLYIYRERAITLGFVKRAEAAGAEAIVLTVDAPGLGTRERDVRNRFQLPPGLTVENLAPLGKGEVPVVEGSGLAAYVQANFKQDLGFEDLDWLCGSTPLPVVVKGVCRGDDARRAVEHGAKAIVVSNHGGRQLDTAPATSEVLPEWRMRRPAAVKSMSMAGFGAAATCSRRLRWGRGRSWSVARFFGDCRWEANRERFGYWRFCGGNWMKRCFYADAPA